MLARLRKNKDFFFDVFKNKSSAIVLIGMILLAVIGIFHDYIAGNIFLIYKFTDNDWRADAIQQIWPNLLYLSRCLKEGHLPAWNFSQMLGMKDEARTFFDYAAALGKTESIPYALNWLYMIKIVFSGIFFYKYIMAISNNRLGAIITAFSYSFCGPMMLRGSWKGYPNEVLAVAVLLYFSECYVQGRYKKIFPIIAAVFSYTVGAYYSCFYVIVFSGYAFWRCFSTGWNKANLRRFMQYEIAYWIGFVIGCRNVIDLIYSILHSARFAYTEDQLSAVFSLADLPLDFMGSVNPSFFGIEDRTYTNVLQGPEFYCGLLTFLLLPQVIRLKDKTLKKWYFVMFALIGLYLICPWLRMVTAGGGRTAPYKVSSFWIIPVLLTISSSRWGQLKDRKMSRKVFNISCIFTAAAYAACRAFLYPYNIKKLDVFFLAFLAVYCLLINLFLSDKIKLKIFVAMVCALCVCETVVYFYDIFNGIESVLTKNDLQTDVFYNYTGNSTYELVNRICDSENERFYRMEQIYVSTYPCDSVAYGYHGIRGYVGGTWVSKYAGGFMRSVSIRDAEHVVQTEGWMEDVALNTLMSVKYILVGSDPVMYGYSLADSAGAMQAYRNSNFLPIGYTYDKYMDYDEFMSIPIENRGAALLEGCVLTDGELLQYAEHMDCTPYVEMTGFDEAIYQRNVDERKKETIEVNEFEGDYIRGTIGSSGNRILFFSIPYDEGWTVWIDGKEQQTYCIDNGLLGTYLSEGQHDVILKWSNPMGIYIIALMAAGSIGYVCYCWFLFIKRS